MEQNLLGKGFVLLWREISLKLICEKVKFSNLFFSIILVTMNGQISKLFNKIVNDVQTEGKGEINTA